jgi:tripartite-type tricarboxylate transporter receptor subunit TctC
MAILTGCTGKSEYPSRPITLVCPWSPGGGTDQVSRQIAVFLEAELDTPVNVINATGGQGVTGHSRGLHARPDGYTLAMMTLELNMMHWRGLTKMTYADCIPLISVNEDAAALFVRSDAPWKTLTELSEAVKREPGKLKASGTAYLAAWHLALAGWLISMDQAPDAIAWIPYGGAGPSIQELMSGGVDMVCCSLPEARTLYEQGELRCLGVMSQKRVESASFADIPTFAEQGFDWQLVGWRGLGLPLGTPPAIQDRLLAALERIVTGQTQIRGPDGEMKTFARFMDDQEYDHTWRKADDFAAFLNETDDKFGQLMHRPEFKPVSSGQIGPMFFPDILLGMVAVLGAAVTWREWRIRSADDASLADSQKLSTQAGSLPTRDRAPLAALLNPACICAAVLLYVAFADRLGFVLTVGLLLFLLLWKFGNRVSLSLLISVVVTPLVYQLFAGLLRIPLPYGVFGW